MKRKPVDKFIPPAEAISEEQIKRTYAELKDTQGRLPELDLHGLNRHEAEERLLTFLSNQEALGQPCCLIIHGKGEGVLQQTVARQLDKLRSGGKIKDFFPSQKFPGGAIVVMFKE